MLHEAILRMYFFVDLYRVIYHTAFQSILSLALLGYLLRGVYEHSYLKVTTGEARMLGPGRGAR